MKKCRKILLLSLVIGMLITTIMGGTALAKSPTVKVISSTAVAKSKSVSKLKIKLSGTTYSYTGKAIKPTVKVYDGSKKLKVNTNYTITYSSNKNPGKAKVTIKGKGKYTGSVSKTFYIAPKKAKITSVKRNSKKTSVTIKWNKDTKATGYKIYMATSKNGKYKQIKKVTNKNTTSYTKTGLSSSKTYYFKVLSYKKSGSKEITKSYSDVKSSAGTKSSSKLLATITLNSSGSTSNRNFNLKRASNKINGKIIKPGETFNWFKVVGPATASTGYKKAIVFSGNRSVLGYGGGVCQVSTTLYQASKKAGLKIVERHMHSLPVSYTTRGNDATVSYGSLNLRIKNNKKYSIKFVTSSSGGKTTCKIYKV